MKTIGKFTQFRSGLVMAAAIFLTSTTAALAANCCVNEVYSEGIAAKCEQKSAVKTAAAPPVTLGSFFSEGIVAANENVPQAHQSPPVMSVSLSDFYLEGMRTQSITDYKERALSAQPAAGKE